MPPHQRKLRKSKQTAQKQTVPFSGANHFELVTARLHSEFKGDLATLVANCLDGENPTLWIQFTNREVEFSTASGDFGGGQNKIMWRFNAEKPETGKWHSIGGGVLLVPRPGRFMLKLTEHQEFVIRAESSAAGKVTAIFAISRSGPVIDEVLRYCPNAPKRKNK